MDKKRGEANNKPRREGDEKPIEADETTTPMAGVNTQSQAENTITNEDSPVLFNVQQVMVDAAKLLRKQQTDFTIPTEDSAVLRNTQRVLEALDNTLQRHEQIRETMDPDDTTLMRSPQRVLDLTDSLFKDNARLRREQKKDHQTHTVIWCSLLTVILIQFGIILFTVF